MTDMKSQDFIVYVAELESAIQAYNDPLNPDEMIRLIELTSEQQVIYAHAQSSNDWMLTSLVHQGREEEAIYLARLRKDTIEQFNGLFTIWQHSESSQVSISELMQLADRKFGYRPPIELCKLGVALARVNEPRADECFAKARENILSMIDVDRFPSRDNGRTTVADYLMVAQRFDEAREVVETIEYSIRKNEVLKMLSSTLARAGRIEEANQVADTITYEPERINALSQIASALAQADDPRADDVFRQIRIAIIKIDHASSRDSAMSSLAQGLSRANRFDEARTIIETLKYDPDRDTALSSLAEGLARTNRFDEARKVIDTIQDDDRFYSPKQSALRELVDALIQAKHFDEVQEVANAIQDADQKAKTLIELTTGLAQAQQFDKAREVADNVQPASEQAYALFQIMNVLVEAQRFDEAREIADSIQPASEQAYALIQLANALDEVDNDRAKETLQHALTVADTIQNEKLKANTLSKITVDRSDGTSQYSHKDTFTPQDMPREADYQNAVALRLLAVSLARAGDPFADDMFRQAREATNSIREIRNSNQKSYAQRQLATVLAEFQRFDEAHEIAIKIDHDFVRADTLQTIAKIIAKVEKLGIGEVFQQTLNSVVQDQKAPSRLETVIQAQRFDEAREIINAITNGYKQSKAQCYLVSELAQARRFDEAREIVEVMNTQFVSQKAIALCDIAIGLAHVQRFDEAHEIAETISVASQKATALFNIAITPAQVNDAHSNEVFSQAQAIVEMIQDPYRQKDVYIELATVLVQAQHIDKARQVIDNIDNNEVKASFLLQLAVTLAQSDDSRADEFFQHALTVADSIENEIAKADTLGKIGVALAQAHHFDQALALAEASQYDVLKTDIWIALVPALIEAQEFDKAHTTALKIPDGFDTKDVRGQLIRALLANNNLKHAVTVFGLCDIDSYVSFLAEWQPILAEQYPDEPNLWQRMILRALEIICWVRKDYEPVRDTFRAFGDDDHAERI